MKYLFFDTETTGKPKDYRALITDLDNWPRLVQLAYIVQDDNGEELALADYIIKPNGFTISEEVSKIHGITHEQAMNEGHDLQLVLEEFQAAMYGVDVIVGHNISFDMNVVGAEFLRANMKIPAKPCKCTMKSSTDYCQLPGMRFGQFKWPKLQELHVVLFGEEFENAHNALADIRITAKCFNELKKRGVM